MDLPSGMFIKNEKDLLTIEENLDFNFDVKIEEIPLIGDWSISNGQTLKQYENREKNVTVSYDKLREGYLQNCSRCFQWFPDSFELIKHNLTHLEIKTVKLLPKKQFKSQKKTNKKNQTKNADKDNIRLKCTKCDNSYKRRKDLNKHIKYIHEAKEIACDICPTKLNNKDALKTHMRNCHTEFVYCDICDSKLKSMSYMHAHMRRVHYDDGKVHSCEICTKIFKSPRYLKIHMKNSHKPSSNKTVKVSGKRNRENLVKQEPEWPKLEIDQVPIKIEYEEPISYEIEMSYEVALA